MMETRQKRGLAACNSKAVSKAVHAALAASVTGLRYRLRASPQGGAFFMTDLPGCRSPAHSKFCLTLRIEPASQS
jgi:hypothetical protein